MADDIFDKHVAANQVKEQVKEEPSAFQTSAEMRESLRLTRQRNVVEELASGFQETALAGGIRRAGDEGTAAAEAFSLENPEQSGQITSLGRPQNNPGQVRAALKGAFKGLMGGSAGTDKQSESYVKADNVEALIEGIPRDYHDDIMSEDTLEGAQRSRARILADMDRQAATVDQFDGGITNMAGQLIDVDASLMFLSGGMYGAAKVARTVTAVTKSQRAVAAAQGVVGGAQAGLLVGAYDAHIRETVGEGELVSSILGGAAFGSLLAGAVGKDLRGPLEAAERDYLRRVSEDDPTLAATNETVAGPRPPRPMGTDGLEADAAAPKVDSPETAVTAPTTDTAASPFKDRLAEVVATPAFPTVTLNGTPSKSANQLADADANTQVVLESESFGEVADLLESRGFTNPTNVGSGKTKVALEQGDEVVRVMRAEDKPLHSNYPRYLSPTYAGQVGDLYVEVMPKVTLDLTAAEVAKFDKLVKKEGYTWVDANIDNLGRGADGKIYIIDGEVFPTVTNRQPGFGEFVEAGRGIWKGIEGQEVTPADLSGWTTSYGPSTVGAAQIDGQVRVERDLVDPLDIMSPGQREIIDNADAINYESGFYDRKLEDEDKFWTKVGTGKWTAAVGAGFQSKLYNSNSAVLNWMGHTVFESSNGLNRGRATASAMMENYSKRIQTQLLPVQSAANDWAQRNGKGALGTKYGISNEGKAEFNREIMLEINARNHGRKYSDDEAVVRVADATSNAARDAHGILKGRDGEHSVKGMENVPENPHYTPQIWQAQKITALIKRGIVTRDNLVVSLAESYREAGMAAGKDADAIANAVIRRVELRDADIDTSVFSLLQGDGRDFLRDSLEMAGVRGPEQEAIMTRLAGAAENRGKQGFAKSRNDVDMQSPIMTEDGSQLQIVDLLSNDLSGDWQRYTRGVAGSAALARQGITSKAARSEVISAAQAEQRALGEEVTATAEMEAMFTHFDSGAVKGWSGMDPRKGPESQGMLPVMMKRLTNLAWLGKMGFTQLGETGAIMAQNGVGNWMKRGVMANLDAEIKAGNKALLNDLAYMTGEIGQDHKLFAEHLSLDELSDLDSGTMMSKIDKNLSTASYVQGFTSFFNSVRGWQQQTAALGVSDKIFRTLKDSIESGEQLSDGVLARFWGDLGLDGEALTRLEQLITDGTIEFSPEGFVNRLNADKWDGDLADVFGASITRNINQLVQKSMAGEQDAWMHTGWGSVLSHLKTFPLQATQKQFVRHFRHNDPQAYSALGMGLATAGVASMVRAGIDGKSGEMSVEDHAKRAFAYSNMTGFIPMAYDPLMTMMGLDDKRFSQFGRHAEVMPPILSFTNNAIRLPGALAAAAAGTADGSDKQAMRVIPFSSTILVGNMLNGIAERNK